MECGVACLSMICRHYGRKIPALSLKRLCSPTVEGVSLKGISDAAISLGFNAYPVKIPLSMLEPDTFPCILHWNQNHFVVLYGITKSGKYLIADPGKGKYACPVEVFRS